MGAQCPTLSPGFTRIHKPVSLFPRQRFELVLWCRHAIGLAERGRENRWLIQKVFDIRRSRLWDPYVYINFNQKSSKRTAIRISVLGFILGHHSMLRKKKDPVFHSDSTSRDRIKSPSLSQLAQPSQVEFKWREAQLVFLLLPPRCRPDWLWKLIKPLRIQLGRYLFLLSLSLWEAEAEVISFRSKGEKLTAVDSSGHLGEGEFCGFSSVQSALN